MPRTNKYVDEINGMLRDEHTHGITPAQNEALMQAVRRLRQPDLIGPGDVPGSDALLVSSELRYRRMFETANDGILILDGETGLITDANPFVVELLGYAHTELVGKQLWEIGPVKDILASQDAMRHLRDNESISYDDLPLETKSKRRVQVEFVSNVYRVGNSRVIQCNVREITARKDAERAAQQVNADQNAMLMELKQRDAAMGLLSQMSDLLHACATQDEAYKVISLMAGDVFLGQSGVLAVLQQKSRRLEFVASWGDQDAFTRSFSLDDCWAMRRGQTHEVTDSRNGLVCGHFAHQPANGYVCVPLTIQGETLGALCATRRKVLLPTPEVTRQLVIALGETVKLSFSNLRLREKLREQAITDVLTGLYNRRYMDDILTRELSRAVRNNSSLCVAMLDLDDFKKFNDAYGHDAGDVLLAGIGRVLHDNVRGSDIPCRLGGEEFLLIFPDVSLQDAWKRVEQIRLLIRTLDPHKLGLAAPTGIGVSS